VAQLVKHPTLDFGSGHVVRVVKLSPTLGFSVGSLFEVLSLPLPLPLPTLSPSKKRKRKEGRKEEKKRIAAIADFIPHYTKEPIEILSKKYVYGQKAKNPLIFHRK